MRRFEHFDDKELRDLRTGLILWQEKYKELLRDKVSSEELEAKTMVNIADFVGRLQNLLDEIRAEISERREQ